MDTQAQSEMIEQMTAEALAVEGVRNVETLWVRKSGLEYFADIHIEVDANLTIELGHQIGHRVKARLVDKFVSLRDVLVHLEPYHICTLGRHRLFVPGLAKNRSGTHKSSESPSHREAMTDGSTG